MYRFLLISTIVVMYVINIQIGVAEVPQMMSYQGQLTNADGVPVPDGTYELVFSLYPDSLLPDFFWQEVQEVEVTGGLFDVQLGLNVPIPFGPFLEIAPPYLYLGIAVVGNPEMLPRTMLSSGAFAIKAFHSDEAEWTLFSDAAGVAEAVADSSITGASIADGSIGLQDIGQNGASPGQIIKWTPSGWDIADDATGGSGDDGDWTISGDILFTGGKWGIARLGNVLYGNHDSTHVNLGTECTTGTAALNEWYVAVGGGYGNSATRVSSTISGGFQNRANGTGSTIGGGTANRATHTGSTVGGGGSNSANGIDATVAGGNINAADADFTIVAGGLGNQAQDTIASVLGGKYNYAYGVGSTIGGGMRNAAHGQYSFVGGGGGVSPYDSNAAIGDQSVVVGGRHNVAVDEEAAVVCGHDNSANGAQSFVGAGQINQAIGQSAVVAGGYNNVAQDMETTISGGANNIARSRQSAIGGGSYNETDAPAGYHANATVAGGHQNKALHQYATVAGGGYNEATARMAAICGGIDNHATDSAAIVCGGGSNVARGKYSAVVGGGGDYGSLDSNAALAAFSFVGGGTQNVADGDYASVLGGRDNRAQGDYSVAVGRHALALHDGCFVWADATNSSFASVRDNELAASVANGMRVEASSDMFGTYINNSGNGDGIRSYAHTSFGDAWAALYAYNVGTSPAIYGYSTNGYAGYFAGDVVVTGSVLKAAGSYRIDHPGDPSGKYLEHGFVGSSEMKNVYDGVVTLNGEGEAVVNLPEWFEALNGDFRYQLTAIGAPGPNLYIAKEISGNRFRIAGGESGMRVSWQVTGIRKDAYSSSHPLRVEQAKSPEELGKYLHPDEHGMPVEKGINYNAARQKAGNSQ